MVDTPRVELNLGGTWTDVSSYVRYKDAIKITRGQRNEGSSSLDNATCDLTLTNSDGRFSPRHPSSPYYGLLGRNTPIRVSLPYGETYFEQGPAKADNATAPDATALDITGDIDIRIECTLRSIGTLADIAGKWEATGNQLSWAVTIGTNRGITLFWTEDGSTLNSAASTAVLPPSDDRTAIRVTLDVDNGSSGSTATFYTSTSIDGSWTQLGDAVTAAGTTSIFSGSAPLEVGCVVDGGGSVPTLLVHAFELRDGIGGTVVADPDFTVQTAGDTSFTDTAGNTWTINGDGALNDRRWRFHGEVAEWPPKRDITGRDATVSVKAAGVSRRLKQGESALRSPIFRTVTAIDSVVSYWPFEDAKEATRVASSDDRTAPMTVAGTPKMADYNGFTSSDPLPVAGSGRFAGVVAPYTPTGELLIRLFVFVDEAVTGETSLLKVRTSGSAVTWEVKLVDDGDLRTLAYDDGGTELLNSRTDFLLNSLGFLTVDLQLKQVGSNIQWVTRVNDFVNTDSLNSTFNYVYDNGTLNSRTVGRAMNVVVGDDGGLTSVILGHLLVSSDISDVFDDGGVLGAFAIDQVYNGLIAFNGENPTDRMERLCDEEELTFRAVTKGHRSGNFVTLGDQLNKTLLDLLTEAADTDLGILFEPRDFLGFAYRTRQSMYNQEPALTLSCADHELNEALEPVDDDQRTVNDVTVKREGGSSVRAEETSGPLSTASPQDGGVGRYNTSVTLSLETDAQLPDQAGWRLHLGTVDEARFPKVQVHLAHPAFAGDAALTAAALEVDIGDRLVITDPSADLPPDDISQLVIGYSEVIDQFEHVITYVCAPESPWHVGQVETDGYDRLDSEGSTLAADATSSATSLSVASTGPLWTTDADDLPFDVLIGGERMTVTAVSGTSSPQTFTVTRSVNGVEKAQTSGTAVTIAEPVYLAL